MGKSARIPATAALLFTALGAFTACHGAASAQQSTPPAGKQTPPEVVPAKAEANVVPNRITGYTAWDDEYFYIALQVTKPALIGTNKEPFSDPLADDAVLVSLQTDNDHKSTKRTANTVTVGVSEAGGMQVFLGEKATPMFNGFKELSSRLEDIDKNEKDVNAQQAKRIALLSSVPKIQVSQIGAPRPGASNYPGYTVEIAIPWADLGGKPESGSKMGFNAIAISKAVGSPKLLSLAATVHGLSDAENPSLLNQIVFSSSAKSATTTELYSPRVISNKPVIDGQIADNEWNRIAIFEFGEAAVGAPEHATTAVTLASRSRAVYTPLPVRPAVQIAPVGATPAKPHVAGKVDSLVFAKYEYNYQADTRSRVSLARRVFNTDHSSALAHHPLNGVGPWFSFDHVDWHLDSLQEARREGIDVVLPIYRGDPAHRRDYADKGLLALASALDYLKKNGRDYPQVGLSLDATALLEMMGDRVDLREQSTQDALYGIISNFYLRIPSAFRCAIALDLAQADGARVAYPVFITGMNAFKEWDGTFTLALRSRFRAQFGGADLLFLGPDAMGSKAALDGYVVDSQGQNTAGWIKTVSINAGFDLDAARPFTVDTSLLTSRKDGLTYRSAWQAALSKHPDWVVIDNWNDFSLGGEVAPSVEAGFSGSDTTRIFTRMFAGTEKLRARFLWTDAPAEAIAKSSFVVQVRLQNSGILPWSAVPNAQPYVTLAYRWKRDGRTIATESALVPAGALLPGADTTLALKVQTNIKGQALDEGDYVLEIGAASGKGSAAWISEDRSLNVPVKIHNGETARTAITVIESDLPAAIESGSVYTVTARLRNDSGVTWRKSTGSRITARIYRIADATTGSEETPIPAADATMLVDHDVAPGEETVVTVQLPVMDPEGKPLPAPSQESPFAYAVRWEAAADAAGTQAVDLKEGAAKGAGTGAVSDLRLVSLVDFDFGVRFVQDGTLASLPGERRQPITLGVKNAGPQAWKKDTVRVGYHWYYQDGTEFLWEDETTAVAQDIAPGGSMENTLAWVTPPPCDGNYYVMWDVKFGDTWASTVGDLRIFDSAVHAVSVTGGRLVFSDLTKAYNTVGVSDINDTKAGDFDGKGNSFPAALIPPFNDDGVVPAGIWQPYEKSGPESPRHISFRWGSKEPRNNNFIACKGQRIDLTKSGAKARVVHIVAASTGTNVTTNVKLVFQEPSGESEDLYAFSVSRWDQPPVNGEEVVFTSSRHHGAAGSVDGAVSLYHYTFVVRDPRKLIALLLPNEPGIKIAAITIEK